MKGAGEARQSVSLSGRQSLSQPGSQLVLPGPAQLNGGAAALLGEVGVVNVQSYFDKGRAKGIYNMDVLTFCKASSLLGLEGFDLLGSVSQSFSHSVTQSVSQSVSQSVIQSFSQSVIQSVRQAGRQAGSRCCRTCSGRCCLGRSEESPPRTRGRAGGETAG